jgi:hypothetical protein
VRDQFAQAVADECVPVNYGELYRHGCAP